MKYIYTDGREMKGFDIPVSLDSDIGWEVFGTPDPLKHEDALLSKVAAAYRVVNLNADALASLPFALMSSAGVEYATSQDWSDPSNQFNQIIPNPRKLLQKWRKSLAMRNAAYGFIEKKRGVVRLRYIAPDTIRIDSNAADGIIGFWRKVGTAQKYYSVEDNVIVPIIKTDWDTEVTPSESTEFRAFADAAGILYHSNRYVKDFFARNAIKPHMLLVKGTPSKEDRERLESVFSRMMAGLYKYFGKVFNAEAMEPIALGSGVDDFKDNGFYKQALEDIAMATGIPLSLLLSNSANLATARIEYQSWYDNRVIPDALFMQAELNDNFFSRFDMRIEFRPEDAEPNQEDEARKSQSVSTLVASMYKAPETTLAVMANVLGYDITEEEYAELLEIANREKEAGMERQQEMFENRDQQDSRAPQVSQSEIEKDKDEDTKKLTLTADQINELATWQDIARRKINKGQALSLPLTAKHLPDDLANEINTRLEGVTTLEGIKAAFEIGEGNRNETSSYSEIKYLADALIRFAETPERKEVQPVTVNMPPVNFTLNEKAVEVKADVPSVTVNVPDQPAPIVNVTNEVKTPEVTVNNQVEPSPVVIREQKPKKAKVKRDKSGNIQEITTE